MFNFLRVVQRKQAQGHACGSRVPIAGGVTHSELKFCGPRAAPAVASRNDGKFCPATFQAATTQERGRRTVCRRIKRTGLQVIFQQLFAEESRLPTDVQRTLVAIPTTTSAVLVELLQRGVPSRCDCDCDATLS